MLSLSTTIQKRRILSIDWFVFFFLIFIASFKYLEPFLYWLDNRNTYFMIIVVFLTLIYSFLRKYHSRDFLLRIFLIIISCLFLVIGDLGIALSICVGTFLSCSELKRSFKLICIVGLALLLIDILCSTIFDFNSTYNYYEEDGTYRYSLSFSHPNTAPTLFLSLISLGILFIDNHKKIWFLIYLFYFLLIFSLTKSLTFLVSIALLIISTPFVFLFSKHKNTWFIFPLLFIVFTLFSFMLGTIFDIQFFNDLLSGRPYYFSLYIHSGKVSWISGRLNIFPDSWVLDNYFLSLIYITGVPIYIFLCITQFYFFKKIRYLCDSKTFTKICFAYLLLMFASLTGDFLRLALNPILVIFTSVFLYNYEIKRKKYVEKQK